MLTAMAYTARKAVFPFAQALPAAAGLWKLATQIESQVAPARRAAAQTALNQWQGVFAQDFATAMNNSEASAHDVANALRQTAQNLAAMWARAQYQQQIYLFNAMTQHKHGSGLTGAVHTVEDFFGAGNYGNAPQPPAQPSPPDFAPTPVPQAHVPGETPPPIA